LDPREHLATGRRLAVDRDAGHPERREHGRPRHADHGARVGAAMTAAYHYEGIPYCAECAGYIARGLFGDQVTTTLYDPAPGTVCDECHAVLAPGITLPCGSPLDPTCRRVAHFLTTLDQPRNAGIDDELLVEFEREHLTTCKRCQAFATATEVRR